MRRFSLLCATVFVAILTLGCARAPVAPEWRSIAQLSSSTGTTSVPVVLESQGYRLKYSVDGARPRFKVFLLPADYEPSAEPSLPGQPAAPDHFLAAGTQLSGDHLAIASKAPGRYLLLVEPLGADEWSVAIEEGLGK